MQPEYRKLVRASDVTRGAVAVARYGVVQVGVTRLSDGTLVAFKNACPHAGSPLSGGRLTGSTITCGRHGWDFDLRSGACPMHPEWELKLYDVREVEGWVEVAPREVEIW